jgi:hypothetical protein
MNLKPFDAIMLASLSAPTFPIIVMVIVGEFRKQGAFLTAACVCVISWGFSVVVLSGIMMILKLASLTFNA